MLQHRMGAEERRGGSHITHITHSHLHNTVHTLLASSYTDSKWGSIDSTNTHTHIIIHNIWHFTTILRKCPHIFILLGAITRYNDNALYDSKCPTVQSQVQSLTHRDSLYVSNWFHSVNIPNSDFRYPQSTADVCPLAVTRSHSLQSPSIVEAQCTLWTLCPCRTHSTQPVPTRHTCHTIACLWGVCKVWGGVYGEGLTWWTQTLQESQKIMSLVSSLSGCREREWEHTLTYHIPLTHHTPLRLTSWQTSQTVCSSYSIPSPSSVAIALAIPCWHYECVSVWRVWRVWGCVYLSFQSNQCFH